MGSSSEKKLAKNEECTVFYQEIINTIDYMIEKTNPGEKSGLRTEKRGRKATTNNESRGLEEAEDKVNWEELLYKKIIERTFEEYKVEDLRKLKSLVEILTGLSMSVEAKAAVKALDYLQFIKIFCDIYNDSGNPVEYFIALLGHSTDPVSFEATAYKIFKIVFFRQNPAKIAFYDLSLIANLWRLHFREDAYIKSVVRRLCYNFVMDISLTHVANGKYIISKRFMRGFAVKIESLINTFNGLVNEMPIDQSIIPKIIFVFLIFHIEKRSIFLQNFGEPELFYCAVRTFYSGIEFAKKLENFIKTRLFWEFKTENTKYTIDKLFQTIYKHEYKKIIGSIKPTKIISGKYSTRNVGVPSCTINQKRHIIKTSVLNVTPKVNRSKTVNAFSPLSQRIGEAAGIRDNFDSKRKLNFK